MENKLFSLDNNNNKNRFNMNEWIWWPAGQCWSQQPFAYDDDDQIDDIVYTQRWSGIVEEKLYSPIFFFCCCWNHRPIIIIIIFSGLWREKKPPISGWLISLLFHLLSEFFLTDLIIHISTFAKYNFFCGRFFLYLRPWWKKPYHTIRIITTTISNRYHYHSDDHSKKKFTFFQIYLSVISFFKKYTF